MAGRTNMWTPIQIDSNISADKVQGLIGIEECINYAPNIISKVTKRKLVSDKNMRVKKKKFNNTSVDTGKNKSLENDDFAPSKFGSTTQKIEDTENLQKVEDASNISLEAWSSFGLPQTILQALQDLKFSQPTQIQSLTLHAAVLGRRDILGAAETGSGKTLAFGLPILAGILKIKDQYVDENGDDLLNSSASEESDFEADQSELDENGMGCVKSLKVEFKGSEAGKPLYALILTPTRELAIQIKNHLDDVAKHTGINVAVIVGGMAAVKQERILRKGPEIVVATPGRLWELIQQGNSHLSQIHNIRFLAIDETDRMLERGHFQELHDLLMQINLDELKKKNRQNFVFSATLTLVHDLPNYLKLKNKIKKSKRVEDMTAAQKLKKIVQMLGITDPKVIDITQGIGISGTLTECRITCDAEEKDYYVYYFLKKHPGRTLIFCNSIGCVKRLTKILDLLNCHPLVLHASMQQRQRLKNLERFRDVENSILVATDIAARGLDVLHVDHVLHYQTPRTSENYIHRSGRTARALQQGITILLIEPDELQRYLRLCRTLGKGESLPVFPTEEYYLSAVKRRVNLAREIDILQLQVRKANSEAGWFQKAAEHMDIIVDDLPKKYDTNEAKQNKKIADRKMKQLASLLAAPIFPKEFDERFPLNQELPMFGEKRTEETAVDLMKSAVKHGFKQRQKKIFVKIKNKSSVAKLDGNKNAQYKKGKKRK